MNLGPFVRRLFGPYERTISDVYRRLFVDIELLVGQLKAWQPSAANILEVGCGEGAVTERLRRAYPGARITAIDITASVGRLYRGPQHKLSFLRCTVQEIAARTPGTFDLVILSDVLHHVPVSMRQGLLDAVRITMAPGAKFVFKDWQRNHTPIHWLCYASDRWLTGDRIQYMTRDEMRELLARAFGNDALVAEARNKPWWNNLAFLVKP